MTSLSLKNSLFPNTGSTTGNQGSGRGVAEPDSPEPQGPRPEAATNYVTIICPPIYKNIEHLKVLNILLKKATWRQV